jgi:hypothetical protein
MRIVEAMFVVVIVTTAMVGVLNYTFLPSPNMSSSEGLEDTGLALLRTLDEHNQLTTAAFSADASTHEAIQKAIDAAIPPNVVYSLSVTKLEIMGEKINYVTDWTVTNFEGKIPAGAKTVTYPVISPKVIAEAGKGKISVNGKEITLFILNCTDAWSWFPPTEAVGNISKEMIDQLSPWFTSIVIIHNTTELRTFLNDVDGVWEETGKPACEINNAVVLNPLGSTIPINRTKEGNEQLNLELAWELGKKTSYWNLTYVCYIGYPDNYGTNGPSQGLAGATMLERKILDCFLIGLDVNNNGRTTAPTTGYDLRIKGEWTTPFTSFAKKTYTKYGVYPGSQQPGIFLLESDVLGDYHLVLRDEVQRSTIIIEPVVDPKSNKTTGYGAAGYIHWTDFDGDNQFDSTFMPVRHGEQDGAFVGFCLTQYPDPRVVAIGLLQYYQPQLYRLDFTGVDTVRYLSLTYAQMGAE